MLEPLRRIWFTSDQPCGKRLKAAIPLWLPHYETHFGALEAAIRNDLLTISAASLDRLLKPLRLSHPKGLSGTKPGSLLKNQIPIRTHFWDETLPGFVEADTLAHCGHSLSGDFVLSLTRTDIVTGWTEMSSRLEQVGSWCPRADQGHLIPASNPSKGFDYDNGSEFLNHHLVN